MKMKRFSTFYFGLLLGYFYFLVTGISVANQLPVQEKQVDVITLEIPNIPTLVEKKKKTVDVRKVARNLHNKEMYREALRVLSGVDNAYLSSSTVNLLKSALNDNSVEVRLRATRLLGLSRNSEAIAPIADRLQNDSSSSVRGLAAQRLGKLAGDAAVPLLKAAWAADRAIRPGVMIGLGDAGGTVVPFLIERLKEEIERNGGNGSARRLIDNLEDTADRRVIEPLMDIISRPALPSDPNMIDVKLKALGVLIRFADEFRYSRLLKYHAKFSAIDVMRPTESRRVSTADRVRIIEFLKKIVESEPEYTVEPNTGWVGVPIIGWTGEKPVIQAAYEALERIERRMALLEKYGPKSKKALESESK